MLVGAKRNQVERVGLTGDGEIADELVRVGGAEELNEVDVGVLAADDGGDIEALEVVKGAAQLEGLLVALEAGGECLLDVLGGRDIVGVLLVDGESLLRDLLRRGLGRLDSCGGHCGDVVGWLDR